MDFELLKAIERIDASTWKNLNQLFSKEESISQELLLEGIKELIRNRFEKLSYGNLEVANKLYEMNTSSDAVLRNVVCRCYYAQYHAGRALCLYLYRTDEPDCSKIIKKLKKRNINKLATTLATYLSERNKYEYHILPEEVNIKEIAEYALEDSNKFLEETKTLLTNWGIYDDE